MWCNTNPIPSHWCLHESVLKQKKHRIMNKHARCFWDVMCAFVFLNKGEDTLELWASEVSFIAGVDLRFLSRWSVSVIYPPPKKKNVEKNMAGKIETCFCRVYCLVGMIYQIHILKQRNNLKSRFLAYWCVSWMNPSGLQKVIEGSCQVQWC